MEEEVILAIVGCKLDILGPDKPRAVDTSVVRAYAAEINAQVRVVSRIITTPSLTFEIVASSVSNPTQTLTGLRDISTHRGARERAISGDCQGICGQGRCPSERQREEGGRGQARRQAKEERMLLMEWQQALLNGWTSKSFFFFACDVLGSVGVKKRERVLLTGWQRLRSSGSNHCHDHWTGTCLAHLHQRPHNA